MGSIHKELKARQRAERDSYPENLSLRVHRAPVLRRALLRKGAERGDVPDHLGLLPQALGAPPLHVRDRGRVAGGRASAGAIPATRAASASPRPPSSSPTASASKA